MALIKKKLVRNVKVIYNFVIIQRQKKKKIKSKSTHKNTRGISFFFSLVCGLFILMR